MLHPTQGSSFIPDPNFMLINNKFYALTTSQSEIHPRIICIFHILMFFKVFVIFMLLFHICIRMNMARVLLAVHVAWKVTFGKYIRQLQYVHIRDRAM